MFSMKKVQITEQENYELPPPRNHLFTVTVARAWGKKWTSQVAPVVRDPPAEAGDAGDAGLLPGWGRSPGGGRGNPLQCSCLENPTDRGAWRVTVHEAAKSWTGLSWTNAHRSSY